MINYMCLGAHRGCVAVGGGALPFLLVLVIEQGVLCSFNHEAMFFGSIKPSKAKKI